MPRFLVFHQVPADAQQEDLINGARKVTAALPPGVSWLNSWYSPELQRLICEWEAADTAAIHASLEPAEGLFPVESLYEVEWIDPEWYR